MYTLVITQRLADDSVICELSYALETMVGDDMESEMVFQYLLFPSETMASTFAALAENVEPQDLEMVCRQLSGEFLW